MTAIQLANCLAEALNLLMFLNDGEWCAADNEKMRRLQDALPEKIDLLIQDAESVSPADLLATDGRPRPA